MPQNRKTLYDVLDRFRSRRRRLPECDRPVQGSEEHGPSPTLGQSVIGAVYGAIPELVLESLEGCDELAEDIVLGNRGYVLHRDHVRPDLADESGEVLEKSPAFGAHGVIALRVAGERLAGRTAREHSDRRCTEPFLDLPSLQLRDVGFVKGDSNVIRRVRVLTGTVEIDARDYSDASVH
jgi:hypothetical protein